MSLQKLIDQVLALHDLADHFVDRDTLDQLLSSDFVYLLVANERHITILHAFKSFQQCLDDDLYDIAGRDKFGTA